MDNKTLAFNISIEGISNEAKELEKLHVWAKNLNEEMRELEKLAKKGIASDDQLRKLAAYRKEAENNLKVQKELKRVMDTAPDSLARMKAELIKLKAAYDAASASARDKMAPAINKLSQDISKAEQAIGTHSRGVGNYKGAVLDAAQSLTGFAGISATVITVLNKLKEAFLSTQKGIDTFNIAMQIQKQLLYDVIKGQGLNIENLQKAAEAQAKLNEIRKGDRSDMVEFAKLEREISMLEFDAADKTKDRAVRQEALNKAIQKQNELSDKRVEDAKEELLAVTDLLKNRKDDETLLTKQAELIAKIYKLDADRFELSKRNQSRMSGFIKEENEEFKKQISFSQSAINEWIRLNAVLEKGTKEYQQMQDEIAKVIIAEAQLAEPRRLSQEDIENTVKYKAPDGSIKNSEIEAIVATQNEKDRLWEEGMVKAREAFAQNKKLQQDAANESLEIDLAKLDSKQAIADAEIAVTAGLADAIAQLSGKNKALSLTALATEKAAAIAQIIANISIANAKSMATSPLTLGQPWVSLNTGLGAISIAKIIAETANSVSEISRYATGGKISGGLQIHADKSKDNTLIYAKQGETVLTESQVSRLGGSGAMRKARVPGYAMGGYIGQQAPEIPAQGFDYAALARMIPKSIVLDTNKVRQSLDELEVITTPQQL